MALHPDHDAPSHRFSPTQATEAVAVALAQPSIEGVLAGLHAFEFDFAERFEWPWMRWRHLSDDDPAYLAALPQTAPTLSQDIEQTILNSALDMRRGGTPDNNGMASARASLFTDASDLMQASAALGPSLQLELTLTAYHERKWQAVELLALRLLATGGTLAQNARTLLTDMVFFAVYRRHMPGYVDNPRHLYDQLEALKNKPEMAKTLGGDSTSAILYRANMLAMKGNFEAALPLYANAASAGGFVSPVFPHAQVLLPLEGLTEDKRTEDMQWYHARSKTEFVYSHPPEGEHALMVACEQSYFDQYGDIYCQIVGYTNPDALIHFHLINFPADRTPAVARLREMERACNVRINHTFEDSEFMAKRPQLKGGVCVHALYLSA